MYDFVVVVTPFADIVLLSLNSATAIVINVLLAIIVLNEVFICRYDLPALTLIISGSVCIVMTANFSEHVSNVAVHKENLSSIRSVCFYSCVGIVFYLTVCLFKRMRKSLATFERETDLWLQSKEKHNSEPRDEQSMMSGGHSRRNHGGSDIKGESENGAATDFQSARSLATVMEDNSN